MMGFEKKNLSICFGHAFSKTCQYATTNEKVYIDLWYVSIKTTQGDFQKCITWRKKWKKGSQEWEKACVNSCLP
jgi:hypothetical protein